MNKAPVSIIIVTYNNEDVIGPCLDALSHQTCRDFRVIVVDNNSHDRTRSIAGTYDIQLIALKENRGFTGGNIEGLRHAESRYIVLLNPDTIPENDWLERLTAAADQDPAGILGSKLVVDGTSVIDSAGDGCSMTGKGYKRGEGRNSDEFAVREHVFGACGGAMLIKAELIEAIGFLDDDFFLIHEDTDYNFRAQLAGWSCLFVPEAVVRHKVGSSIGKMNDMAVYYSIRNARFVLIKNMPARLILKHLGEHAIQEMFSFFYVAIKQKKLGPYLKAHVDVVKALSPLLVKRRKVMGLKKVSNGDLEKRLTPFWDRDFFREKVRKLFGTRLG